MKSHRGLIRLLLPCLVAGLILPALAGCARGKPRDRRVLIMNFEDAAPDAAAREYSTALAEMMTACLANSPRVAVLDRQDLGALMERTGTVRWQEIGKKAGADYVIVGSIAKLDANFLLTARLLSVRTGQIVKGSSVTRSAQREEDIYPAVQAIGNVLGYQLKYLAELYDAQAAGRPLAPAPAPAAGTGSSAPAPASTAKAVPPADIKDAIPSVVITQ